MTTVESITDQTTGILKDVMHALLINFIVHHKLSKQIPLNSINVDDYISRLRYIGEINEFTVENTFPEVAFENLKRHGLIRQPNDAELLAEVISKAIVDAGFTRDRVSS